MRRWRYRPLQAAAVVALAALMTACAAFAPLYYRAMQQALTEITIDNAPVLDSSVLISVTPSDEFSSAPVLPPEVVANKLPAEVRSDFHEPILSYSGRAEVLPGERTDPVGELVWRSDQCDHLEFTAGACPTATARSPSARPTSTSSGSTSARRCTCPGPRSLTAAHRCWT